MNIMAYAGREEELANTPLGKLMDALVDAGNFDEYRPYIAQLLQQNDMHPQQVERVLTLCREKMAAGMGHALALTQAITAVGPPALKKEIIWHEGLRERLQQRSA